MIVGVLLRLLHLLLPQVLRLDLLVGRTLHEGRRSARAGTRGRVLRRTNPRTGPLGAVGGRCRGAAPPHSPRQGEDRSPTDGQDRGRRASRTKSLPGRVGG